MMKCFIHIQFVEDLSFFLSEISNSDRKKDKSYDIYITFVNLI